MKRIAILLLFTVFLSGCWDAEESVRMLYVHGVGIDFKDNEYHVHFQVISFANVARSEQINQDVMQSEVGFAKGKTVNDAFRNLYKTMDEKVYWGHLTFLILGEGVINNGHLNELLNSYTRFSDTRYNSWIYYTDQPMEEFFLETPILKKAISLTKLANPINSFENQSLIEPINIRKFIIKLNEPNHLAVIPYVEIEENVWQTEKGPDPSVKMDSVALITPHKFKGLIKGDDLKGFQWLSKETKKSYITTEINGDYISLNLKNHKAKIKPVVNGNNVKFDIDIYVETNLDSYSQEITPKEIEEAVKKAIKKEIEKTFKKGLELECDVFRFSEQLYRHNVKTWKKLENKGVIPLTEASLGNIEITITKMDTGKKKFTNTIISPE